MVQYSVAHLFHVDNRHHHHLDVEAEGTILHPLHLDVLRRAVTVLAEGLHFDAIHGHDLDPLYAVDVPILIVIILALEVDLDHHTTREVAAEVIL